MGKVVTSFVLMAGLLATHACSKKQVETAQTPASEVTPEAAAPSDSPATVTMTDGSQYHGALVSKNGSQMTFRGDNGATRTLDSRDIQSIRFGNVETASTDSHLAPPREAANAPSTPAPAPQPAPEPERRIATIPSGTPIAIRNNADINSKTASAGQTFSAVIASNVVDEGGTVAIPRGSAATLIVREAGAGRIHTNDLALALTSITIAGVPHRVQTATLFKKGKDGVGANKRTAIYSGGGAAVGALIGGLVGGGKGAGIGAASGAGAGAGTQIMTRGSVKIPSESLMSFTLEASLTL
jgi:hypothetical protein